MEQIELSEEDRHDLDGKPHLCYFHEEARVYFAWDGVWGDPIQVRPDGMDEPVKALIETPEEGVSNDTLEEDLDWLKEQCDLWVEGAATKLLVEAGVITQDASADAEQSAFASHSPQHNHNAEGVYAGCPACDTGIPDTPESVSEKVEAAMDVAAVFGKFFPQQESPT